ncbi:Kinesin-like protein KIN-4A-like [Homarus americanus]|uniref:Kinesin-like protein KIN-4A-like n=1 Tax=Homarus americanus TaxID=6706 RepID=A0A8J5JVA9_HOMAM|nr:Kinesin-like protein KIN-4A-like [Homarus americanus]
MFGQQFTEGVIINKGLLALSKILAALSNPTAGYVPYRKSVLTRLLNDSLGGNSYTAMIACVSPGNFNVHETIKTLHYAEQARNIRTKPQILSTIKRLGVKRCCEDDGHSRGLEETDDGLEKETRAQQHNFHTGSQATY